MRITYDPAKRLWTMVQRGLDFEDAGLIFRGATVKIQIRERTMVKSE